MENLVMEVKELLPALDKMKLGDKIKVGGFLRNLSGDTEAHLVEVEAGRYWEFQLYWNTVPVQRVCLEKREKEIIVDTLGSL
jgi:hypothetical protein